MNLLWWGKGTQMLCEEVGEEDLCGEDEREGEEDDDDGPVDPVVPGAVDPAVAEQGAVVEEKLKEDDGRREDEAGKDLHADDDQL